MIRQRRRKILLLSKHRSPDVYLEEVKSCLYRKNSVWISTSHSLASCGCVHRHSYCNLSIIVVHFKDENILFSIKSTMKMWHLLGMLSAIPQH